MNQYIFTEHRYEIETQINTTVKIIPFGDVHRDSPNCSVELWKETLKRYEKDPQAYFLGMGDYLDKCSESERTSFRHSSLHSTTLRSLDDGEMQRVVDFADEMKFARGKVIGLLEGNHHWVFANGTTSTQKLCELLGCRYLGYMSYITLAIKKRSETESDKTTGKYISYDIVAHHGKSSGRTAGSTFNSVDHLSQVVRSADLYAMGHDHQRGTVSYDTLQKNKQGKVKSKQVMLVRTGTFLRSYVNNQESYAVKQSYRPSNLGNVEIHLTLRCGYHTDADGKQHSEMYLDRHCLS